MDYTQGSLGRVFVARLRDGEPVYDALLDLAERESLRAALVFAVGGARRGQVVVGPKHTTGPIEPQVASFDDARELVGIGTLFPSDSGPSLHFHAGIGRGESALVGCPRIDLTAFLVLEVVVIELLNVAAARVLDPASGLRLLSLLAPGVALPASDEIE